MKPDVNEDVAVMEDLYELIGSILSNYIIKKFSHLTLKCVLMKRRLMKCIKRQ
jgi:hypothetical protein